MTAYANPTDYWTPVADALEAQLIRPRTVGTGKVEYFIDCPNCGAKGRKFSISERGCHCFLCGFNPSLSDMLARLGGAVTAKATRQPKPAHEKKAAAWQANAKQLAWEFTQTPGLVNAWQQYKPVSRETIQRWRLGYGVFPGGLWDSEHNCRCQHPRLIVPLFGCNDVIGFRCRAIDCDCTKWLSPGGSRLNLYGGDSIRRKCDVLVIAENPIDALLVKQEWEGQAVATLGVSIWRDEYTVQVLQSSPQQVVIWFDNDAPGQTTNPAILAEWNAKHPNIEPPLNGIKLTNRLLETGLNATFYRWPNDAEKGADIGGFFK